MKSKIRRKKRITLQRLLVSSVLLALIVSFTFAFGFREYLRQYIRTNAQDEISRNVSQTLSKINRLNAGYEDAFPQINAYLSAYTYYDIDLTPFSSNSYSQIVSNLTDNCYIVSAIIDKDQQIVASNRQKLQAVIKLDNSQQSSRKSRWYVCDKEKIDLPQLDELSQLLETMKSDYDTILRYSYEITLDSVYINQSEDTFVPHKGQIRILKVPDHVSPEENYLFEYETVETKEIDITFDDENYELIALHSSSDQSPHAFAVGFNGIEETMFDTIIADADVVHESSLRSSCTKTIHGKDLLCLESTNAVYINGAEYTLYTEMLIDESADAAMKIYWTYVTVVLIISLVIAFLWSWQQNVINKARYAFEDYQKALINNLAHDLKTPMTAIGGYTENAKKQLEQGSSEPIIPFLDAITSNVFYIDAIVNRALELNHLNQIREVKKELVQMHKIAETAIEKYNLMLDEKNISVEMNGTCEVMADRTTLESAVENLISNAVKYTAENGRILITADQHSFTITNDTTHHVNTDNLIMPFVKGDTSRNEMSSGIGLAIVQSAADLNRLKLIVSSSENQFSVTLKK